MNDTSNINTADLPFQNQLSPLILLQALSPQAIPGDPRHIAGAMAGMFAGRLDDEQVLFAEFTFQPIGFSLSHPEFGPDQKAPVTDHGERMPREAQFHYAHEGYARSGHWLPSGNQIVPTINAFILVDHGGRQHPSGFRFSHSAYPIGRQFGSRAAGYKAVVEGEKVQGCTLVKHKMTAYRETRGGRTYYLPKPMPLGKVGEVNGPTLAEYHFAEELRRAFKEGLDWASLEPPEPPALPAAKAVVIEADPPPCDDDPNMVPESVVDDAEEIV
jgi:hypothetical protein